MRRHRREMNVIAEMNLTNMLDTAFVLVLALLMVAPVLKHGVQLQLPQTGDPGTIVTQPKTLTITITKSQGAGLSDWIYLEDERVSVADIQRIVSERRKLYPKLDVIVEADKDSRFETWAQVVAGLKIIGVEDVSLPTDTTTITPPDAKKAAAGTR